MKKSLISLLSMLTLVLLLSACGNSGEAEEKASADEEGKKEEVTIEHELGETTLEKNPEHVVVFDFGTLDTLDSLGVEVTGLPQMNIPSYLSKFESSDYKNAGGLKEPDFEAIYDMDPDLIIISGRQADLYEDFKDIAPTIYVELDAENYMESFKGNVEMFGKIFDKEKEAEKQLLDVEENMKALQEKTADIDGKGLITLSNGGKVSAYGPGSRFGIIHDVFGVPAVDEDLDVSTHGQNVSYEYIAENNPDYLFVVDRDAVVNGEAAAKQTIENDLVKETTAFKEDQIVYLDPDIWYLSGGGLTSVQMMVDEIDSAVSK
ncbi:siderophore ABC transporter substrate-binding protein [Halobacillus sp. ACCC02827]|uniref:siderophore ABC transporter substrate-binding protein n=1 Tax=Halobacillus sp. ACCC02827 TaxID=3052090 RepID=UPI002570ADB6|nr:siderophore ABC transporter substrate-binding protein [Halobacillus sp. ACCC02827]WJE16951.1 siderophore ABC transporter substrate-binding protein [Halobacillus sp. ACCC02827]